MKSAAWLPLLALVAGCGLNERPSYVEPEPAPVVVPDPPPERFLRVPANYVYRDPGSRKEYAIRGSGDDEFQNLSVTVHIPGNAPRPASVSEAAFAFDRFREEWLESTQAAQRGAARRRVEAENRRRATLVEEQLRHVEAVIKGFEGDLSDMKAELASLPIAGKDDGHRQALQARVQKVEVQLIAAKASQAMLTARRPTGTAGAAADDGVDDLLGGK